MSDEDDDILTSEQIHAWRYGEIESAVKRGDTYRARALALMRRGRDCARANKYALDRMMRAGWAENDALKALAACEARWAAATERQQTQYDLGAEWHSRYDELAAQNAKLRGLLRLGWEVVPRQTEKMADWKDEVRAALAADGETR